MRKTTLLAVMASLVSAALWVPAGATAQGWMEDRSRREGPGFRVGEFEFHPGLGIEAGYDTNTFLSSGSEGDPVVGSFAFRFTPHLDISNMGEERAREGEEQGARANRILDFRMGVAASVYVYVDDEGPRNVGLTGNLAATLFPEGLFSLTLHDEYSRTIRPFTTQGPVGYGRHRNTVGLNGRFQSQGGMLQVSFGYDLGADIFEDAAFDYGNNLSHEASAKVQWRFLPLSSLFSDVRVSVRDVLGQISGSSTLVADLALLRARLGFTGALTPKVSLQAAVGYASLFYFDAMIAGAAQERETFIGSLRLGLHLMQNLKLNFGYERDLRPALTGNSVIRDSGNVALELLAAGSFLLTLRAGVSYLQFGPVLDSSGAALGAGGTSQRDDIMVDGALMAEYRFTDWLAISANLDLTVDISDFEFVRLTPTEVIDPAGYTKFQAWLGARIFY